jgi:hypothetical protein
LMLKKLPRQTGLVLGLAGLTLFTLGFVFSKLSPCIAYGDKPNSLWLLAAWVSYPILGFLFYFTNSKLSLIFGLVFLLFPPMYVASYNSVSSIELDIVRVQRVFGSSPIQSVTLVIDFGFSARLASLPVAVSDMTLESLVTNETCSTYFGCTDLGDFSVGVSTVKGGTFFPYGRLDYQLKFTSSDASVVKLVNDTQTHVTLMADPHPVSVSSLTYSQTYSQGNPQFRDRFLVGFTLWDWRTESVGAGCWSCCS